jgi:hypothetical protein
VAVVYPPTAFSDAASLSTPDTSVVVRTDYDLDGRAVRTYTPRYSNTVTSQGSGNDGGGTVNQQTAQCPTGQVAPQYVAGLGASYPSGVGVCSTRASYDVDGNTARVYPGTSNGSDNRYLEYAYTDDDLPYQITTPAGPTLARVTQTTVLFDSDRRQVKSTDANNIATQTSYTADGLASSRSATGYGTVSHCTAAGFNANGQQVTSIDPRGAPSTVVATASTPPTPPGTRPPRITPATV